MTVPVAEQQSSRSADAGINPGSLQDLGPGSQCEPAPQPGTGQERCRQSRPRRWRQRTPPAPRRSVNWRGEDHARQPVARRGTLGEPAPVRRRSATPPRREGCSHQHCARVQLPTGAGRRPPDRPLPDSDAASPPGCGPRRKVRDTASRITAEAPQGRRNTSTTGGSRVSCRHQRVCGCGWARPHHDRGSRAQRAGPGRPGFTAVSRAKLRRRHHLSPAGEAGVPLPVP